jgi:N-acetylmuramoyl-L-alanine amidase
MASHVVEQGECFATIARDNGMTRDDLYQHPDNAELRQKRPSPFVLHPGDVVSVPDHPLQRVSAGTEMRHRYVTQLPQRELRVTLKDASGKPISNETYAITIGDDLQSGTTDGDGLLVQKFRRREPSAKLVIQGRVVILAFGEIDPVKDAPDEGASGARERLRNLGYDVGDATQEDADDNGLDGGTRTAIALFQHHAGIDVTGKLDDATMAKLVELHGS